MKKWQKVQGIRQLENLQMLWKKMGVVAQMPVAAEVGSGDERDELGSG